MLPLHLFKTLVKRFINPLNTFYNFIITWCHFSRSKLYNIHRASDAILQWQVRMAHFISGKFHANSMGDWRTRSRRAMYTHTHQPRFVPLLLVYLFHCTMAMCCHPWRVGNRSKVPCLRILNIVRIYYIVSGKIKSLKHPIGYWRSKF